MLQYHLLLLLHGLAVINEYFDNSDSILFVHYIAFDL